MTNELAVNTNSGRDLAKLEDSAGRNFWFWTDFNRHVFSLFIQLMNLNPQL